VRFVFNLNFHFKIFYKVLRKRTVSPRLMPAGASESSEKPLKMSGVKASLRTRQTTKQSCVCVRSIFLLHVGCPTCPTCSTKEHLAAQRPRGEQVTSPLLPSWTRRGKHENKMVRKSKHKQGGKGKEAVIEKRKRALSEEGGIIETFTTGRKQQSGKERKK